MTVTTYQCLGCGDDVLITDQPEHNDVCSGERVWCLSPASFEATRAKIDKLNARAVKKGFTGRLELVYEKTTVEHDTAIGKVSEVVYKVRIGGEPPSYNGWRLIASVDFIVTGAIVNTAPGVTKVDRSLIEPGKCDHCKHNRQRVKAYLVINDQGEQLQVGSTCLKDFIGWSTFPSYVSSRELSDDLDGFLSGGYWPRTWSTEAVLMAAWATIKLDGYVRAGDWEATPTKRVVEAILDPSPKEARKVRERYGALTEESREVAQKTREFILSDDFAGDSEYVLNMKTALSNDSVEPRHFGLVVSAPQAWARHQERSLIRERERTETVNEFVGNVKERITVNVKVKSVRYIAGDFGSTTLYTMVADTGHVFKWFASSDKLGDQPTTEFQKVTGTIKDHNEYNGVKSTIITRCKVG